MENSFKIGDKVRVEFLGAIYVGKITGVYEYHSYRDKIKTTDSFWITTDKGVRIPAVGVNGSEKFANILELIQTEKMTGTLTKKDNQWAVKFLNRKPQSEVEWFDDIVALHPDDQEAFRQDEMVFDNLEARVMGKTVEFDLVDEFTHPHLFTNICWGDGVLCAKITKI